MEVASGGKQAASAEPMMQRRRVHPHSTTGPTRVAPRAPLRGDASRWCARTLRRHCEDDEQAGEAGELHGEEAEADVEAEGPRPVRRGTGTAPPARKGKQA